MRRRGFENTQLESDEDLPEGSEPPRPWADLQTDLQDEDLPSRPGLDNGVGVLHSTIAPAPLANLPSHYLDRVHVTDYAASPVFSPNHGPRSNPVAEERDPVQPLYTTLQLGGYSCTSV